jgi:hypothetical protein
MPELFTFSTPMFLSSRIAKGGLVTHRSPQVVIIIKLVSPDADESLRHVAWRTRVAVDRQSSLYRAVAVLASYWPPAEAL